MLTGKLALTYSSKMLKDNLIAQNKNGYPAVFATTAARKSSVERAAMRYPVACRRSIGSYVGGAW